MDAVTSKPERATGNGPSFGDAAMLSLVGSGATIGLGVVLAKWSALLLGPAGVGQLAEVRQVATTILVPLSIFTGPALISAMSEAYARDDSAAAQRTYNTLTTACFAGAVVLSIAAPTVTPELARVFGLSGAWIDARALLFAAAGAGLLTCCTLPAQAMLAQRRIGASTRATVLASAFATFPAIIGTYLSGVRGQLAGALLGLIVAWPVIARLSNGAHPQFRATPRLEVRSNALRRALTVGGGSLAAGLAAQGTLSVIRGVLQQHGGDEANGQFQAAWAVGANYLIVVMGSIVSLVFPRYASASPNALKGEIEQATRFVLRTAPPIILLAIAARQPIVRLLYSDRFQTAAVILGFQMAGDLARALGYVLAGPLLYRGHVGAFLLSEIVGSALMGGATVLVVPRVGVVGTGYAYFLATFVSTLFTSAVLRRACRVGLSVRYLWEMALFAVFAFACAWVGLERPWLNLLIGTAGIAWAIHAGLPQAALLRLRTRLRRPAPPQT